MFSAAHAAGHYVDCLVLELELFKNEHRGGTAHAHLMRTVATRLTLEQMRAVAHYYALAGETQ